MVLAACGGGDSSNGDSDNGDNDNADSGSSDEWLFITEETGEQVQMAYANEFKKRIEEKTDGDVTVTTYEFGGLGTETDNVVALQENTVQLAVTSPGFIGNTIQESQIFGLHYLFPDSVEETHKILNESEAINVDLVKQYEAIGLKPLSFWTEGFMMWTSNEPVTSVADFENFKMRIQGTKLQEEAWKAYGGTPQTMSWGDLYTGLENGTVDGQDNPIFFIADASFHEVQDYMTLSRHNNYVATTTVNMDWFEGLSEDYQQLVVETVEDMQDWIFEEQKSQNEHFLEVIKESGTEVVELSEEELAEFKEASMPVRDFYREEISRVDGAILDKLEQEIEEIVGE